MLDIRFIRENSELVAQKSKQKGYEVNVPKLLERDKRRRELQTLIDEKRAQKNELSLSVSISPSPSPEENPPGDILPPSDESREKGREVKNEIALLETEYKNVDKEFKVLLKQVPNMPLDDVPVGASEAENVVAKEVGEKPRFDFEPKNHWEIAEARGLIDKERAAKVAGSRFAYIKGDLVRLQFGLIQFAIETLTNEEKIKEIIADAGLNVSSKPFIPVLPPAMVRTEVYEAMDRLEPSDDRYRVGAEEDNLWLQGSAEHTLGPMYMDEILPAEQLPIRYLGYATSFRREAGSYGKDQEGIIRMHQFDKLEMESFSAPQEGLNEHLLMVAIQEYLVKSLGLSYRVLQKCTADIGKPNARGIDIDIWMPGQNAYRETHTADFMTDYQSRRLQTRVKTEARTELVHTNDATAYAPGRILVAIIENYQNADGTVRVPEVLQGYLGGKTQI
jgi:seryl-tRNA synthetase